MTLSNLSLHIESLRDCYQTKKVSPTEVIEEVYRRIDSFGDNPAWIYLVPKQEAIRAAASADPSKPLYGIPFAVKDNIDVADVPTTAGCPAFAYIAGTTATVVDRLLQAGAIFIGKTNLDQFATGLVGTRSPYGLCHSVLNSAYISGGSSSGSAVVVAGGLVSFALGTDTAGSGRVPAAFNNIIGLKPSCGLLSTFGVIPACRSLDCVSIFALTADDAQGVLNVAAGEDSHDPFSRPAKGTVSFPSRPKIGILLQRELIDDQFRPVYEKAISRFVALGSSTVDIDLTPFLECARLLYDGPWIAERFSAVGHFIKSNPDAAHPVVREIIMGGEKYSAAEAFEGGYTLKRLHQKTAPVWREIDFLLLPTAPGIYKTEDVLAHPVALNSRLGTFTNFVNLLDLAAIALPAGWSGEQLPFGITLIGPAFSDSALLEVAQKYLSSLLPSLGATGHPYPPAKSPAPPASSSGLITIAVVGAHLSGLPLNYQLTNRGACFLEVAATAPDYRFYSLPGTTPPKPGLVRTEAGAGSSIEVEIWEMPLSAFGSFVNEVSPPLTIGTLQLLDGRLVKGFLCESVATTNARDISSFGGWRNALREGKQ